MKILKAKLYPGDVWIVILPLDSKAYLSTIYIPLRIIHISVWKSFCHIHSINFDCPTQSFQFIFQQSIVLLVITDTENSILVLLLFMFFIKD